jgi:hypothetical protein
MGEEDSDVMVPELPRERAVLQVQIPEALSG